jgi:hypothetical protein
MALCTYCFGLIKDDKTLFMQKRERELKSIGSYSTGITRPCIVENDRLALFLTP